MKRTATLAAVVLAAWPIGSERMGLAADSRTPPNIVLILADDMGFSDAGCYGGEIQTPNLDGLARGGLRFTQFYNTARCWPSRASILTGYYAQQVRRDELPGLNGGAVGRRPAWARLLPELLHPLGYRSYHSGKWHVDGKVLSGGFDRSYSLEDHDRHFNPTQHTLDDRPLPAVKPGSGYYTTTAIAQHAIEMLAEHQSAHRQEPFFLYLAFTCPHFPLHAPPEDIAVYRDRYRAGWDELRRERYERMTRMGIVDCSLSPLDPQTIPAWNFKEAELRRQIGPGEVGHAVAWSDLGDEQRQFQPIKMAIHAAMIHRMDIEIGRVLQQLKAMGAFENTVVFFLSDNGASAEQIIRGDRHDPSATPGSAKSYLSIGPGWSSAANTPLRLHKSWVHEGGISTPLVVHWPRGIAARGQLRHNPGHLIDLAPTILELAGGRWPTTLAGKPVPPPPGKSLVPVFANDGSVAHDYFWWYHIGNRAICVGDWKLVAANQSPWELFDLRSDRSETKNLAAEYPEKVKELAEAWTGHMQEFRALAQQDLPPRAGGDGIKTRKKPAQVREADRFGPVEASGLRWLHLSSRHGDLPVPGDSRQQTAAVVADLDKDGRNDFVLAFRETGPALVWYRRTASGWDRYVIEKEYLTIEAGGAVCDIDGDGYPDLVFGGDWQSNRVWWWRNPGKDWKPDVPWQRYTIKKHGATQHHDQCFADFKGLGKPQLAYWNQGAKALFVADIPPNPREVDDWPAEQVFSGSAGENPGKYAEGMSAFDVDGDGRPELLAGNHMFKHRADGKWSATKIGDVGGLIFAGHFIKDAKRPQIVIAPGDGSGPVKRYECHGDPLMSASWIGHDLVGRTMVHPHSLQVADFDGDGNLDIFVAEMAKWSESKPQADNPNAQAFIFYGDGKGNFRKTVFQTGMGFHEARVADLDGDGRPDILSKPYNWDTPRVDVWLNQGRRQAGP
jgi:arylsulfatase A-like enzyme